MRMLIDNTIDNLVSSKLLEETNTERENRTASGKLSASMLAWPLQWQVLKTIGVGTKVVDGYTLRKFKRGNHVEEWMIGQMPNVIEKQKFVEFRGAIGFVDAVVNTRGYEHNFGVIPHEVKSVSNAKFRRIEHDDKPDNGHVMQTAFYALALGSDHFAIDYVATDDYRIKTYILFTGEWEKAVIEAIEAFDKAMEDYKKTGAVPVFEAKESWQKQVKYNNYPIFMELTGKEASTLAKKLLKKEVK